MSAYVLVHGAWHGGWCWDKVAALLRAAGHTVATPDLPGHGQDRTPLADITLDSYARRVAETIDAQAGTVVLVGHSMGGMVITQAAEWRPDRIRTLVYLTAFIPRDGESLSQLSMVDPDSLLNQNRVIDRERGAMWVRPEALRAVFYHDCSDEDAQCAERLLAPEIAIRPMTTALRITPENFGRVPRAYIECLQDRAIRLPTQRLMQANSPCEKVISMDTSHSPFLSAPAELARLLDP